MDQHNSNGCLQDVIIAFQKFRLLQIIQIQFRIHLSIWEIKATILLRNWRRAKESKKKDWLLLKLLGQLSRCESACVGVFHHIIELFFLPTIWLMEFIFNVEKKIEQLSIYLLFTVPLLTCLHVEHSVKIFLFYLRPTAVLCCYCLG